MSNSSRSPFEENATTPLLPGNDWKTQLPCISEATIDAGSSQLIDFKHSLRRVDNANDNHVPVPVIAFELLVVLYHLTLPGDHDGDIKARLSKMSLLLFGELVSAIKANGDFERQTKFGAFLVYKFKVDLSATKHLCILDLLNHVEIPQEIITDVFLSQSITTLWQMGFSSKTFALDVSGMQRLDNIIRSPRTLHCVHLISHIAYLFSLSALVLYPPSGLFDTPQDPITIGFVAWIILYSISTIPFHYDSVVFHVTAIILILLNFQPDSLSHMLLLIVLSVQIFQLHLPNFPSHILLFKPRVFLPISAFLSGCLKYCLFPSLNFLLPMILVFLVLLSLSLSGVLMIPLEADISNAPPLSVRTGFLIFLVLSFLMLVSLFGALIVRFSTSSNRHLDSPHWDEFGIENGIVARRFLIRAIITYSTSIDGSLPLTYPPPFNIVEYVLVPLSRWLISQIDVRLWYLTVSPFAFVAAGIWLWGNVNI